ncbi:oligosaccharide flippase family protein [Arthrobacter sp. HLT1-20]
MATLIKANDPGNVSRHMALTAFSYLFVPVAALVSAPILAQTLGVDGRGAVAASTAPLLLAVSIFALGLPQAVVHFVASTPSAVAYLLRPIITIQLLVGLLGSLLIMLTASILAGSDPGLTSLVLLVAPMLPATLIVGVLRGLASGLHRWTLVTIERCLTEFLKLVSFVVLMWTGNLTVLTAVVVTVVSAVASGFTYTVLLRDRSTWKQTDLPRLPLKEVLSYGMRIWVGSLSGVLLTRMAQVIMTPLSSVSQLGYYVVAVNVSDASLLANNAVRDVTLASDSAQQRTDRATLSARCSLLISAAMGIVIVGSMPFWFTSLFGEEFAPAMALVAMLVFANVAGVPGSVAGAVLSSRGHPGKRSTSLLIAAVINIVLLVFLLPPFGAFGAAFATLIGNLVASNMNIYFAMRLLKIHAMDFYIPRLNDFRVLVLKSKGIIKLSRKDS